MTRIVIRGHMMTDPDLLVGSCVTLERADGRSVWRQRLLVHRCTKRQCVLVPVDDTHIGRHHRDPVE